MMKPSTKQRLGIPVAAYTGIGYCDRGQHEIVFLTDGFVAVAYGTRDATVSRELTEFTVYCHEITGSLVNGSFVECDGVVTFDITDTETYGRGWGSDPEQLALLVCSGVRVDEGP